MKHEIQFDAVMGKVEKAPGKPPKVILEITGTDATDAAASLMVEFDGLVIVTIEQPHEQLTISVDECGDDGTASCFPASTEEPEPEVEPEPVVPDDGYAEPGDEPAEGFDFDPDTEPAEETVPEPTEVAPETSGNSKPSEGLFPVEAEILRDKAAAGKVARHHDSANGITVIVALEDAGLNIRVDGTIDLDVAVAYYGPILDACGIDRGLIDPVADGNAIVVVA